MCALRRGQECSTGFLGHESRAIGCELDANERVKRGVFGWHTCSQVTYRETCRDPRPTGPEPCVSPGAMVQCVW